LSHLHGDHWDYYASEQLPKTLPVATTTHGAAGLRRQGFSNTQALQTWEQLTVGKRDAWLRITALPAKHGPGLLNALLRR
jgi:L-ascorbate metabolism protein UlaG (beta-lactamase superfamily)